MRVRVLPSARLFFFGLCLHVSAKFTNTTHYSLRQVVGDISSNRK